MSLRTKFLLISFTWLGVIAALAVATIVLGIQDRKSRRQIESDLRESGQLLVLEAHADSLRKLLATADAGGGTGPALAELERARNLAEEMRISVATDELQDDDEQKEMHATREIAEAISQLTALVQARARGDAGTSADEEGAVFLKLKSALGAFREGSYEEIHEAAVQLDGRRRVLLLLHATGLIAMLVLLVSAGVAFSYGVLSPVKKLSKMARQLSRVDFDVEVRRVPPGELGDLTRTFLSMARALEGYAREMEDRVRERTGELEQSRTLLGLMLDNIPDAVALRNPEGAIVACNDSYRTRFMPSDGRTSVLGGAPTSPQGYAIWRSQEGAAHLLDVREYRGAGESEWGRQLRLEYVRDVTRLVEAESALAQSSRLVALGRLAAGIAHEVNNPLTAIGACAEGLLKRSASGGVPSEELTEYLRVILGEVYRCKTLTDRMLDLSRQGREPARPTDVRAVVEENLKLLSHMHRARGIRLVLEPGDPCNAMVQPSALRQILINLLMNAMAAAGEGGTISIEAACDGESVRLAVRDDGAGIAPEALADIFEPFYSGRRGGEGTGLGLFLSRELATAMGGQLEARSDGPGTGACFQLVIPAAAPQESTPLHKAAPA